MDEQPVHTISYRFKFPTFTKDFVVRLDKETLLIDLPRRPNPPAWTEMKSFQCEHCPLDATQVTHCPVAVNLVELIDFFSEFISHEKVQLEIETPERSYSKHASLQSAMSSLLGIYMVTSGCPIMSRLKPMVRFHLPFASLEETRYRAMSMYLMAQYFLYRQGKPADWSLAGLVKIYDDIRTVNLNFFNKMTAMKVRDAGLNAISILDSFADFTRSSIDYEMTDDIMKLFDAYLGPIPPG